MSPGGFQNWNWGQLGKSIGLSALTAGATSGVGGAFGHGLGNIGKELLRAGAHGVVNGGINALQGGSFWTGFGTGAISSFAGSGMSALGMSKNLLPLATGSVGGLTSWGLGGDPWRGFWQGYSIGAFNHAGGQQGDGGQQGELGSNSNPIDGGVVPMATIVGRSSSIKFVNIMQSLAGLQYVFGDAGPNSFDCSGAVIYGIRQTVNPNFPRITAHQLYTDYSVPTDNLSPGSTIFYDYKGDGRIDHVTTVLDANNMLHPSSGAGILQVKPLNYLNSSVTGGSIYYRNLDWNKIIK